MRATSICSSMSTERGPDPAKGRARVEKRLKHGRPSDPRREGSLVTIIVNDYNYGQFVEQAIASALAQDYSRTEVLVVDDGSTDNSRQVISKFGGAIERIFKPNQGQASTFNAGFQASRVLATVGK